MCVCDKEEIKSKKVNLEAAGWSSASSIDNNISSLGWLVEVREE